MPPSSGFPRLNPGLWIDAGCLFLLLLVLTACGRGPVKTGEIPRNLSEAHTALREKLPSSVLTDMRGGPLENMVRYHHGLGTGLRNEWGLWRGGPLRDHLAALGLEHPDDMSGVILDSFWYELQGRGSEYPLEREVARYREFWLDAAHPEGNSPADGARIVWVMQLVGDPGGAAGSVHLGISRSDQSKWRYTRANSRGIEAAKADEAKQLEEWMEQLRKSGQNWEDF